MRTDDRGPVVGARTRSRAVAACTREYQDRSENVAGGPPVKHNGDLPDGAVRAICGFMELLDEHLPAFRGFSDDAVCSLQATIEAAVLRAIQDPRAVGGRTRGNAAKSATVPEEGRAASA